jgi:hypothetical protein
VDKHDRQKFLDFLADLVTTAETWQLTLTEDLNDLDQLVDFLEKRDLSAGRRS